MNRLSCLIPAALLIATTAAAQTATGTISGTVRDASNAVVPGVTLTVANAATGASRSTTTDAEGRYTLPGLEPGDYELRAALTGFRTSVRKPIVVTVGGTTLADFEMSIGQVAEEVTVQTDVPLIEPTKADLSRVVTTR